MVEFITLEGGEGAGKSTQLALLKERLAKAGVDAVFTREPGGTTQAEQIRELIVTGDAKRWHPETETLLLMAARFEHIKNLIEPSLQAGKWVVSDRYLDSTLVYQGMCKRLGMEWVEQLYALTCGNLRPSLTFYLDIDPEIGLKRANKRLDSDEDRFEGMELSFHEQVRAGFLQLCAKNKAKTCIVDAKGPPEAVQSHLVAELNKRFNLSL